MRNQEYASVNRWVLSRDLKVVRQSILRIWVGRVFQRDGAEWLKALAPTVDKRTGGRVSWPADEDRREEREIVSHSFHPSLFHPPSLSAPAFDTRLNSTRFGEPHLHSGRSPRGERGGSAGRP
ncbi:hypothetical protein SRHO_G00017170 [Serrasalmus rhombeus]